MTTTIYTIARLGRAGGLTNGVALVSGREPVSFETFASTHAHDWRSERRPPGGRPATT